MPTTPQKDNVLSLPDGRKLGYAEYGDPNGSPVFHFHGWPSSRLEGFCFHAAGLKLGARIISPDRPGLGLSDFKKGFTVRHWPEDVLALADALGLVRFAVVGISSGAPYVFACARFIADRLTAAGSVGGIGPLDGPNPGQYLFKQELQIVRLAQKAPWLARPLLSREANKLKRDPIKALAELDKNSPEADKIALRQHPEFMAEFAAGISECLRQGSRGPTASIALEGRPWGFRLEEITMKFYLWQGELDNLVYPATARYLAGRLPNGHLTLYPNEAHVSTIINRADEIVSALLAG